MRLGTFAYQGEAPWRPALFLSEDTLLDLQQALAAWRATPATAPVWKGNAADIVDWITPEGQGLARQLQDALAHGKFAAKPIALDSVRHGPPIPRPGKFIAVGRNYMNHVREGQRIWAERGKTVELPSFPAAFAKFASGITAHGAPIVLPQGVPDIDYELELAVVIGRPAYRVTPDSALDCVAGYTVCNDVAARQIQRKEMESQIGITMAKNFPSFAPLGPWMVTADEIADPQRLDMQLTVNGEPRQQASTQDMIFTVAELVAYWSQIGLQPGDMLTTGTPAGVALARPDPASYYLQHGDIVRASITGIGTLQNPVQKEAMCATQSAKDHPCRP